MYNQYIDGKEVVGEGIVFNITNPKTGEVCGTVGTASAEQANQALEVAQRAFKKWSITGISERIEWVMRLKKALMEKQDELVRISFMESGKTMKEATMDFMSMLGRFDYYSEEVQRINGVTLPDFRHNYGYSYTTVENKPRGVVVAHLAWNSPLGGVGMRLAASLLAGCTCVIKPSSETPLGALYVGKIAADIGFPAGVLNIIHGPSSVVGTALNSSTIPAMITLVGSAETGKLVMREGSSSIKYYSLELGGNCPVIVMPDADLDLAATAARNIKTMFCGQICSGFNRFYVHESVYEDYLVKLTDAIGKIRVGYGEGNDADTGSLINIAARDRMLTLIDEAVKGGAKLLCGGSIPEGLEKGAFIAPAVLRDVKDDMRVCREEIFGPICPVQPFSDFDDVLQRAVDTNYGLTSYIFTHDMRNVAKAYEAFESGEVIVNPRDVGGNHLPHPGWKDSGLGCAYSRWSLEEYYHIKRLTLTP